MRPTAVRSAWAQLGYAIPLLLLFTTAQASAADRVPPLITTGAAIPVAADPPAPPGPPGPWSHTFRLGGFLSSVVTSNADVSGDSAIAGAQSSMTWLGQFKGELNYQSGLNRVENRVELKYGRQRQQFGEWTENSDLIQFDGAYKRTLTHPPHYVYSGWAADTVFTGPDPDRDPFDPITVKTSIGYGQRHILTQRPEHILDGRVGVRVQRTWGTQLTEEQRDLASGFEVVLRYEDKPRPDLTYFAQYEGFNRFNDLGHVSNLITAGLSLKVTPLLTVDASMRAFYESSPTTTTTTGKADGYDHWSLRQETLIGLTWDF